MVILTKYIGATRTRPARVSATSRAGSLTMKWDSALNAGANHQAAAMALAARLGLAGDWVGDDAPGSGFAFVRVRPGDLNFHVERRAYFTA